MSARELVDCDYRSQQEMTEIKMLLKVLVESQSKLVESQTKLLNSQYNTQSQILEILKSIGNAGNNNKREKDEHKAFRNASYHFPKQQEEDTGNNSNATDDVAEIQKTTSSVVYEEITQALSDDDHHHHQQHPLEYQLSESTENHTTMEQNLKSKSDKVRSKKHVLDGYEQLYYAAYDGDWVKASMFFDNNPQAIREVITEDMETALHIAVYRNNLVFIKEIVKFMPPEVLEYKKKYTELTALHLAVKYGNIKAAEMMVKKNQKLTQIRNCYGRVPLAYAIVYATGAQKEMVEYLYTVTKEEDPSPFLGHDGASMLCDAINHEYYALALSLVRRFPGLVSTRSKLSKQYGLEVLVGKPSAFLSGAKLTWWQHCIYSLIQVDMDAARGCDTQVDAKNPCGIDEVNKTEKGKYSELTESDEENPSQSIISANTEHAGDSSMSSKGIKEDADDHLEGSEVLISDPSIFKSVSILFMRYLMRVPQIKQLYNQKLMHYQALALVQNMLGLLQESMNEKEIAEFFESSNVINVAIKHGSTEFIVTTLEKLRFLIWEEMGGLAMIHMAIQERNVTILNYLCEIADIMGEKMSLFSKVDTNYNTLLHHAAKLAPLSKLNLTSGAALQMQRELQWFKGVESILLKKTKFNPNIYGDTAQSIFTEEHRDLVEKGEKWMKDTSGSCMVVAALIATVAFAAAFTTPGGNINDSSSRKNGTPVFLETISFTIFAVSDALALFSSVTSVLMFLALYTSRYAEEEFLTSLPQKLVIGLGTLFMSMATILVAFSASLFIMLGGRFSWALIPITLCSCVPMVLFALLQLPLFFEIVCSLYWGSLFSKHRYVQPS